MGETWDREKIALIVWPCDLLIDMEKYGLQGNCRRRNCLKKSSLHFALKKRLKYPQEPADSKYSKSKIDSHYNFDYQKTQSGEYTIGN